MANDDHITIGLRGLHLDESGRSYILTCRRLLQVRNALYLSAVGAVHLEDPENLADEKTRLESDLAHNAPQSALEALWLMRVIFDVEATRTALGRDGLDMVAAGALDLRALASLTAFLDDRAEKEAKANLLENIRKYDEATATLQAAE